MYKRPIPVKENLIYSTYYAPRGRQRLYALGRELAQRYLAPSDLLIGIIGKAGSGKSTLIKGLFPGLELTNDDTGVNVRSTPLFTFSEDDFFSGHTFHIDFSYESAFHQRYEIVESINRAIDNNRRVIVEHFDLLYPHLGYNAQILFGIGEEVIVARPTVFGPTPESIRKVVHKTIRYRLMAHSAEDITSMVLSEDYDYHNPVLHSDVKHGFVISFPDKPDISIPELEQKIQYIIEADISIKPCGESHIQIGEERVFCTGIRTHVSRTSEIVGFHFKKSYIYDPISKQYLLVGVVGSKEEAGFEDILSSPDED